MGRTASLWLQIEMCPRRLIVCQDTLYSTRVEEAVEQELLVTVEQG